ncbi:hypothetical protein D3C87_1889380 [compost metagenome]
MAIAHWRRLIPGVTGPERRGSLRAGACCQRDREEGDAPLREDRHHRSPPCRAIDDRRLAVLATGRLAAEKTRRGSIAEQREQVVGAICYHL